MNSEKGIFRRTIGFKKAWKTCTALKRASPSKEKVLLHRMRSLEEWFKINSDGAVRHLIRKFGWGELFGMPREDE